MTTNLSGSLDAFGLDEVLALLGMGGRTAQLEVRSAAGVGSVHLVDGEVSSASADLARAGLLRQVVAAASVPASDLARALEEGEPVRALVDSGAVDRDQARGVAAEHLVDAMGELLTWREGEFSVWVGEADPGDIGVRYPVHELVDRGRERLEQWDRVRTALPEPQSVLSLVPAQAESPTLGTEEWAVLARIDGRRTLAEVVAAAGCAPLAASDRLVGLIGRGLVTVRDPHAEAEPDEIGHLIEGFEHPVTQPEVSVAVQDVVGFEEPVSLVEPVAAPVEESVLLEELVSVEQPGAAEGAEGPAAVEQWAAVEPVADEVLDVVAVEPVDWEESATVAELAEVVESAPVESVALALPVPAEDSSQDWLAGESVAVEELEVTEHVAVLDPEPVVAEPVAAEPVAVAQPIAPAVEWSPWAQALGLAAPAPAGELIVDPLAGRGIAQLIADAAGLQEVEHVPVPLPPVVDEEGAWQDPSAELDLDEEPTQPVIHDLDVPVPGPRAPGDAVGFDTSETLETPAPALPPAADPVDQADPLAGGLLAQLISGVRGL